MAEKNKVYTCGDEGCTVEAATPKNIRIHKTKSGHNANEMRISTRTAPARPARMSSAKKAATTKNAPAKKSAAKKSPAKKASAKKATKTSRAKKSASR